MQSSASRLDDTRVNMSLHVCRYLVELLFEMLDPTQSRKSHIQKKWAACTSSDHHQCRGRLIAIL